ncbi:hypothetical protein J6590_039182 [Homalodisca vitripennis]|nr:hypothetical protein J6590_039182 [Homalodisca vitripennis]
MAATLISGRKPGYNKHCAAEWLIPAVDRLMLVKRETKQSLHAQYVLFNASLDFGGRQYKLVAICHKICFPPRGIEPTITKPARSRLSYASAQGTCDQYWTTSSRAILQRQGSAEGPPPLTRHRSSHYEVYRKVSSHSVTERPEGENILRLQPALNVRNLNVSVERQCKASSYSAIRKLITTCGYFWPGRARLYGQFLANLASLWRRFMARRPPCHLSPAKE